MLLSARRVERALDSSTRRRSARTHCSTSSGSIRRTTSTSDAVLAAGRRADRARRVLVLEHARRRPAPDAAGRLVAGATGDQSGDSALSFYELR